jgi:hypothetical protein
MAGEANLVQSNIFCAMNSNFAALVNNCSWPSLFLTSVTHTGWEVSNTGIHIVLYLGVKLPGFYTSHLGMKLHTYHLTAYPGRFEITKLCVKLHT